MHFTEEQENIIRSSGNIRINAVAGSGKTTTVIEYARTRPAGSKILYLAFNRSVRSEAERKFEEQGLHHVKVETAHSLAFRHVIYNSHYKVRSQAYKTYEIADLLGLKAGGEKHAEYMIANHINKFITYFCNSDKRKVQELNYLDVVYDKKAKDFAKTFYPFIENGTRQLLAKMDKGEIEIIHDFYLKKFQLSQPKLPYDYILFDEGQDASAAMLDVFLRQAATKVIVGDTHQQIYGWRYAVNSLERADFPTLHLSNSFRFSQDIARLAMQVLTWKQHLGTAGVVPITGKGNSTRHQTRATIARTNLALLLKAIEFVTEDLKVKHIYFEGHINSYTYADDGTSLYDVLNLYNKKYDSIRDKIVGSMKDMDELEEYIENTEDTQLSMMMEIIKEYGNEIPGLIKTLKEKHVGPEEKDRAEMVFSTVHRAKGMEYDLVYLVNDFITEAKLEKTKSDKAGEPMNVAKWNEEINLLYVAITRARHQLHLPVAMVPVNLVASDTIKIIQPKPASQKVQVSLPPVYSRRKHEKSCLRWKSMKYRQM
jgi:superfamily I DNA/RNA helicase